MRCGPIGLIGVGRFGAFLARHLSPRAAIRAWDPLVPPSRIAACGAVPADLAQAASCPVVVFAVPVSVLEKALKAAAPHLRGGALATDVCAVKEIPLRWMRTHLPAGVDLLGTHPLFGPDSAPRGLAGRKIVVCPERISRRRLASVTAFLRGLGLIVIQADPVEHDRQTACSLALPHLLGRALAQAGFGSLSLDTLNWKRLMRIAASVCRDAPGLSRDLQRFNPHAAKMRRAFGAALRRVEDDVRGDLPGPGPRRRRGSAGRR